MLHTTEIFRSGVVLDELFPSATRTGAERVRAVSCSTDWRHVEPGDVFVALPEACRDEQAGAGHNHASRAVSHGAVAVICEQPVPVFDAPTYLVPDTRVALGELSHALLGNPTRSLPTIGVTGTQGKTTTIALLDSIFSQAGEHCGSLSSLASYDGMTHSTGISDAPSAPALAARLARMDAAGCTHALVEVSSQSLAQHRLVGIEFDAICVTNVTEAHLDLHNSIQNYRDAKRRILNLLSPTGVTVLNADDPVSLSWLSKISGPVLTYGLGDQAEITARIIETHSNEQLFVLSAGSESTALRSTIVGDHHVSNCLAAAATALSYGIDLQAIAAGIEALDRLPSRMQRIDCGQDFPVYVDAADTPTALSASLRTARKLAGGRVICVLGDAADHSTNNMSIMESLVCQMADLAIVSHEMSSEGSSTRFDDYQRAHVEVIPDRREAIAWAVAMAEPGDVVVITGRQPNSQNGFGGVDVSSSDAEVTRQLLCARNEAAYRLVA